MVRDELFYYSKEHLIELVDRLEEERDDLLSICQDLYDYFDMNEGCLTPEQESYLERLGNLIGK